MTSQIFRIIFRRMATEFNFGEWAQSHELEKATVDWLLKNSCSSRSALKGLNADWIPVGADGVATLGEKGKIMSGVSDLNSPTGSRHSEIPIILMCNFI